MQIETQSGLVSDLMGPGSCLELKLQWGKTIPECPWAPPVRGGSPVDGFVSIHVEAGGSPIWAELINPLLLVGDGFARVLQTNLSLRQTGQA